MSKFSSPPWLIVAGDFALGGGMDRANDQLAWYLADCLDREVHLVAHHVSERLASHPRVRLNLVARPLGRHILGERLLDYAGRRVARALSRSNPDVRVVVNGGNCLYPAVNWVHLVHHANRPSNGSAPLFVRLRHWVARQMHRRRERIAFSRSPLLLANSQQTKSDLVDGLGIDEHRVRVVYLGCDPDRYGPVSPDERTEARKALSLNPGQLVILFVGALGYDRRKGLDTLLAAARRLCEDGFQDFVILVGGTGALEYWKSEAARQGVADRVNFLGHVEFIPRLLAAADILVSPVRYEPYGLNVHEALCRSVPAIVSKCAGVAERYPIELADLLLEKSRDPEELGTRIRAWHRKQDQYRLALDRVGAELRSRTWDHMADEMVGIVEQQYGAIRLAQQCS